MTLFTGFLLFKDYCENYRDEPVPQLKFYEEIRNYEKTECPDERKKLAKSVYDSFIMKEMLSHTHVSHNLLLRCLINVFFFRNTPRNVSLTWTATYKRTRSPQTSLSLTLRKFFTIYEVIRLSALWKVQDTRDFFSGKISSWIWRWAAEVR